MEQMIMNLDVSYNQLLQYQLTAHFEDLAH